MLKISPSPSTGWRVEGGYGEQPFVFETKAQAISFFLVWAEKHQPCDVHIYALTTASTASAIFTGNEAWA